MRGGEIMPKMACAPPVASSVSSVSSSPTVRTSEPCRKSWGPEGVRLCKKMRQDDPLTEDLARSGEEDRDLGAAT